jgi:hypothetical protein
MEALAAPLHRPIARRAVVKARVTLFSEIALPSIRAGR